MSACLWKNDWTGFFIIYFKCCYYLCVSPFYFQWDPHKKRFKLGRNILQSFCCVLQFFLLGLWYLKDLRRIPVDNLYKNPVVYFSLAFNLNAIYYHIGVLAVSFWRRQHTYLAIVNFNCDGYASCTAKNKLTAFFLCFLFAILPLLYSICGYSVISSSKIWDPSLMFRCLVVEGRFAFFVNRTTSKLDSDSCSKYLAPDIHTIQIQDYFLGGLAFLMETARQVVGFYSDFFPLICCLSIWNCTGILREWLESSGIRSTTGILTIDPTIYFQTSEKTDDIKAENEHKEKRDSDSSSTGNNAEKLCFPFQSGNPCPGGVQARPTSALLDCTNVKQRKDAVYLEIGTCCDSSNSSNSSSRDDAPALGSVLLERYEVCKCFARTVNKALGEILFAYVLSSIMYLSTCMDAVLVLQDWFGKLRVAFFFFVFILMFFIGSEIVNKVYWVRAWLSDPSNNHFLPEKNLLVLIHEVTCKSIGVSGNGMFTITYSTFMTVMTTTVTFFIIILQFQKPRGEWEDLTSSVTDLNTTLTGFNSLISQLSEQLIVNRRNYTDIPSNL